MARMTIGMRRVLWEIALHGGECTFSDLNRCVERYAERVQYGNARQGAKRLFEEGLITSSDSTWDAILRFTDKVDAAERERLLDEGLATAVGVRHRILMAGRAAATAVQTLAEQQAEVFAGPAFPESDYWEDQTILDAACEVRGKRHQLKHFDAIPLSDLVIEAHLKKLRNDKKAPAGER